MAWREPKPRKPGRAPDRAIFQVAQETSGRALGKVGHRWTMRRKKRLEILRLVEDVLDEFLPGLMVRLNVADARKIEAGFMELRRRIGELEVDVIRLKREMVTALGAAAKSGVAAPADETTDSPEGRPTRADMLRDLTYLACRVRMLEEAMSKQRDTDSDDELKG